MLHVYTIEKHFREDFLRYRNYYKTALKSKTRILDIIASYVHKRKENSLLPLVTILSAKAAGRTSQNTYVAATIIDLLFTATRIHDDVEDESFSGNYFNKINDLWKEKLSVLMGDYFLAQGLLISVKNKTYDILEIFSKSVKEITEGELRIIYNSSNLNINKKSIWKLLTRNLVPCLQPVVLPGLFRQEQVWRKE